VSVTKLPFRPTQTFKLASRTGLRPIQALLPNITLSFILARAVFKYFRVGHDLVQKRGVREDRVVYFCELLLVA